MVLWTKRPVPIMYVQCNDYHYSSFPNRGDVQVHMKRRNQNLRFTYIVVLSLINLDLITIFSTLFKKKKSFNKYYHCSYLLKYIVFLNFVFLFVFNMIINALL
jgi:hypothetical protein